MPTPESPAQLIQRQLDAYNAHDLDQLMATYAPDAIQYSYPETVLARGQVAIRARMQSRFADASLHATLLSRTVVGQVVADHELLRFQGPSGPSTSTILAIYEIQGGKIQTARVVAAA